MKRNICIYIYNILYTTEAGGVSIFNLLIFNHVVRCTLTFKYGICERSVVSLVRVGRLYGNHLNTGRLLFADRHHVLLWVHDDGCVVVDICHGHLDLYALAATPDPAILVSGFDDNFVPNSGFPIQWFSGAQFACIKKKKI